MDLKFEVSARVSRPVEDVFEAVVDPAKLSAYFTTGGAKGRLDTGAIVTWDFHDFPGAFPVEVVEVEKNRRIILKWEAYEPKPDASTAADDCPPADSTNYMTTVTMRFEPLDDNSRTLVTIAEEGWRPTGQGLKGSYGNCYGWTQMLCGLKVWVEHGINLRDGFFK